jgi:hypothetical protein
VITGLDGIVFNQSLPEVTLTLGDGTSVDVSTTLLTSDTAEYSYTHDLSNTEISSITFNHQDTDSVTVSLSGTSSSLTVNTFLSPRVKVVIVSSSGGGSLGLGGLIGFMLLGLFRTRRQGFS